MNTDKDKSLILNNIGLVHSCANRFRGRGVEYDDLFQAGCVGLIKAAGGFCAERGFAFSTYAVPAILGEIKRIFRDGGAIKVGRSSKEKARELLEMQNSLQGELGRTPTISELAEHAKMEISETAALICSSMPPISLTVENEESENQLDIPCEEREDEIIDNIALKQVINTLEERDRKLIELRYFHGCTQSITAKALGMTQVQVSRREKTILSSLRNKFS